MGQPDEKRIRKACGRAQQVVLFTYGGSSADIWWKKISDKLTRFDNLTVISIAQAETELLANMVERTMQLQCTIEQGQIWLSMDDKSAEINPVFWQRAS